MKIRYLGTAAAEGWPGVFCACAACRRARALGGRDIRSRSQALIDDTLLIDLPPDTYYHTLRDGLELSGIRTLLITHAHQDHFYPAELMMRGEPYAHDLPVPVPVLTVYGGGPVHAAYEAALRQSDSPDIAERLRFCQVEPFRPFDTVEGYRVTPLLANHDKSQQCLLYLIEKAGKSIFYANDSGLYPQETWAYLAGRPLDLVSFDCTNMGIPDGRYHMGLPDNREAKRRLTECGAVNENTRFVLTHFSHNGGLCHAEIEREAAKDGFAAAYDGMEIEL